MIALKFTHVAIVSLLLSTGCGAAIANTSTAGGSGGSHSSGGSPSGGGGGGSHSGGSGGGSHSGGGAGSGGSGWSRGGGTGAAAHAGLAAHAAPQGAWHGERAYPVGERAKAARLAQSPNAATENGLTTSPYLYTPFDYCPRYNLNNIGKDWGCAYPTKVKIR